LQERPLEFWDQAEFSRIVREWPDTVRRQFGNDLRIVQLGGHPGSNAKPLKGFAIPLWELKHREGQRIVYCTHYATLSGKIFVLDAFEKDSRDGSTMRTSDKDRIERRAKELTDKMDALKKRSNAASRNLH